MNVEAEIIGAYVDPDEKLSVVVRLLELQTPEGEDEEAYYSLGSKVREVIEKIAPETRGSIKILYFVEYEGGLERCAYAVSDTEKSLEYQ